MFVNRNYPPAAAPSSGGDGLFDVDDLRHPGTRLGGCRCSDWELNDCGPAECLRRLTYAEHRDDEGRVAKVMSIAKKPKQPRKSQKPTMRSARPTLVHRFLIVLTSSDPVIWRRIEVPKKQAIRSAQ